MGQPNYHLERPLQPRPFPAGLKRIQANGAIVGALRGSVTVASGNQIRGSGTSYAAPGRFLSDGVSTVATFAISSGTVSERRRIDATFTSLGASGNLTATFDSIYDRGSSLENVASAYSSFLAMR